MTTTIAQTFKSVLAHFWANFDPEKSTETQLQMAVEAAPKMKWSPLVRDHLLERISR